MRTTIELDEDVRAAVDAARRERGTGLSETVNDLIRRGLVGSSRVPFSQPTGSIGVRIDVSNVAEALSVLEGDQAR